MPDTAEQCQITKVTIRIGEKEQTISIEEAKSLKAALEDLFGSDRITYVPTYPTPIYDPWDKTPFGFVPYGQPFDGTAVPFVPYKIEWNCMDTALMSIGEA